MRVAVGRVRPDEVMHDGFAVAGLEERDVRQRDLPSTSSSSSTYDPMNRSPPPGLMTIGCPGAATFIMVSPCATVPLVSSSTR